MSTYRAITVADAVATAHLHAQSWRFAYRGILPEWYLEHDVAEERRAFWIARLAATDMSECGVLALEGSTPVGFAYACLRHSPAWGHLLDNLHVLPERRGRGMGRGLVRALCEILLARGPDAPLHLWVYDQNVAACAFYDRLRGQRVHTELLDTPAGARASASVYLWPSTRALQVSLPARDPDPA